MVCGLLSELWNDAHKVLVLLAVSATPFFSTCINRCNKPICASTCKGISGWTDECVHWNSKQIAPESEAKGRDRFRTSYLMRINEIEDGNKPIFLTDFKGGIEINK